MTTSPGWVIHRYDSVPSTMDVAARLARLGVPERTAVVAAEQTAGRGRAGRPWHAPPGSSLFCTLILRPPVAPERLSTLPLVTGIAVAEAIEALTGSPVQLKWPNDVWIGSDPERRKVAGILVASALHGAAIDHVLVGVGINISAEAGELPDGATSLLSATDARIGIGELVAAAVSTFDRQYEGFCRSGGAPSLAGWRSRAALLGEQVTVEAEGAIRGGTFSGIDDAGALLLRDADGGLHRIVAGDLTRGPRVAPRGRAE